MIPLCLCSQNLVRSVGNDLSDMEDELNRKEPVARDDYTLESQKDDIQVS